MRDIFFVSGLPRSGSTLLVNLLAQHPDVYCTPTSGLHELLHDTKVRWNTLIEHRADKNASDPENLKRVLKNMLYSYHNTDKNIVFDKCRGWNHSIEMMESIMGKKIKIIAPVRNVSEILASFEDLYRKGSHIYSAPGPISSCQNTEGRVNHWMSNGEVGTAYNLLRDVFQRGLQDRLCLVDYDYLTTNPELTMKAIWNFLDISYPDHDFHNVANKTPEDDSVYNYLNLHVIRPEVKFNEHKANRILGENLANRFRGMEFWKPN